MSGGEQQRVAIARALVAEPAVILADEPTGALDSRSGQAVMAIFQKLNRERKLTIVQVSHDDAVARHGRRVVRLLDGEIEREEVLEDQEVRQP
jgi:putative ABC transport system ATP-binding protein